jgi:hypothetical protein
LNVDRVERWIEKLVIVGKNDVWKKDRNMYARLLLSMVLAKSFSDPFDSAPPDGSLPPFPSYLKPKLKNAAGPHESFFWRDVYDRLVPALTPHTEPPQPYVDLASTIALDPDKKETYNLRQLIAEQSRRIEILEEQMHQERLLHEEEIQRFLQHHKGEVERMRQAYSRQGDRIDHRHTVQRSHMSHSYDSTVSVKTPAFKSPAYIAPTSELRRSFDTKRTPVSMSHFDNKDAAHESDASSSSPELSFRSKKENVDTNMLHESRQSWGRRSPSPNSQTVADSQGFTRPPIPISAQSYMNSTMTRSALNTPHADITPRFPAVTPSADISPGHALNRSHFRSDERGPTTAVKSDIRPRPSAPVASLESGEEEDMTTHSDSLIESKGRAESTKKPIPKGSAKKGDVFNQDIPEDDNDFMAYLENFQSEIRNLQFNIPKVP